MRNVSPIIQDRIRFAMYIFVMMCALISMCAYALTNEVSIECFSKYHSIVRILRGTVFYYVFIAKTLLNVNEFNMIIIINYKCIVMLTLRCATCNVQCTVRTTHTQAFAQYFRLCFINIIIALNKFFCKK